MNLSDVSWAACQEYLARDDRVLLPIGATEAHGQHLGLGCDYLLAEAIARRVGDSTGVMVAPTLTYGMSFHLTAFPGTLSLAPATLTLVLQDLFTSLHRHGLRRVLVVNGHGGNDAPLRTAFVNVADSLAGLAVKSFAWWTEPSIAALVDQVSGPQRGTHAAVHETAFLMAVRAQNVDIRRLSGQDAPVEPTHELTGAAAFREKYPDGIMGLDPSRATAELGQQIWDRAVELCVEELARW